MKQKMMRKLPPADLCEKFLHICGQRGISFGFELDSREHVSGGDFAEMEVRREPGNPFDIRPVAV